MGENYQQLREQFKNDVRLNEPLSNHTTFRIGGPADLFCEVKDEEELVKVVGIARKIGLPYFILGGGSNILVGDKGFRGIVVKVQSPILRFRLEQEGKEKNYSNFGVYAEAGVPMSYLLNKLTERAITGLEFMAGIPGTVGGAVRGNAGAWQQSFSDRVSRVKILDEQGETRWLNKEECDFSYRGSRFKENNEIILALELELEKGEKDEIEEKIKEYLSKRETQPKEPSAGCIFVNPKPYSAGKMIEECGLKGKRIGDAQISTKHANFIINLGQAKAQEVVELINLAKEKVKEKFSLVLKEEIVKVGEF